jgi:RNA polymerase sigma factor for flagellar operon FliA
VTEILESRLARPPTQEEVAEAMHLSVERYSELSRISQRGREVHFSALEPRGGAGLNRQTGRRVWDIGDERQRDPSERLSRAMLIDLITRGLTREERLVLILYYCEDLTMAEIGAVLDLSESRVSQIHKDLLERLRKRYKNRLAQGQLVA